MTPKMMENDGDDDAYYAAEAAAEQAAEHAAHMAFHFPASHGPKAWMFVDDPEDMRERELEALYWQEAEAADAARSKEVADQAADATQEENE